LKTKPDWPEALNNLAWLLASDKDGQVRNGEEAVRLASRACELTENKEPLLLGTLAAAYAEAGKYPEAVKLAEKARDLALETGQKDIASKNTELLELYRSERPYHENP
jgi:hypothetical protein